MTSDMLQYDLVDTSYLFAKYGHDQTLQKWTM